MTVIVLAVSVVGLAGTVVVLALRVAGLRVEVKEADTLRAKVEQQLQSLSREFQDYKKRAEAKLGALKREIEDLENDLAQCSVPGSVRDRLRRLLSKETDSQGGDRGDTVPD